MIVNVYLDRKGNILDALVDESTSHRPGDIIHLQGSTSQKSIVEIKTKECFDYGVIVYINKLDDHKNSVDDSVKIVLEGDIKDEV